MSVRGFDRKVYITTRDVVEALGSKIVASLEKGDMTLPKIAAACGEEEGLVRTVVEILREAGDIIEKRKENYALA